MSNVTTIATAAQTTLILELNSLGRAMSTITKKVKLPASVVKAVIEASYKEAESNVDTAIETIETIEETAKPVVNDKLAQMLLATAANNKKETVEPTVIATATLTTVTGPDAGKVQPITLSVDAVTEAPKSDKLAEMLAAAEAQKEATQQAPGGNKRVRVTLEGAPKTSSSKDAEGNARQKRNYETTVRKIVVFKSASLNAAFISTNLAYTTKTYDGALTHMRNDLKPQVRVQPIVQAADVVMEILEQELEYGAALNDAKGEVFDKVLAEGWNILGNRPRTSFAINERLPVETTEEDTTSQEEPAQTTELVGPVQETNKAEA